jgi:hypothetical protein
MRLSGGKTLSLLQIVSIKLYCYHSVIINVIELAYPYNKIFNPVNLVILFLSMQYIRLTTYYHIFVRQLMTDFCLFQCLHQIINFEYFNFKLLKKKHLLKFFRQNNITQKS